MTTLTDVMDAKGITRYSLSKDNGIAWSTLSDVCNGRIPLGGCGADMVHRLAHALDMSVEEILNLEPDVLIPSDAEPDGESRLEADIPPQLRESIDRVIRGKMRGDSLLDCYQDDLYSWINIFYVNDRKITKEQADYILDRYYWC